MLIHDLHAGMVKLIKRVLTLYVQIGVIRRGSLHEINHSDRSNQLPDNDLAIGTVARTIITQEKDALTAQEVSSFFR